MGRKAKTAAGPSLESVRHLLTRGDAKSALKEAKVFHQKLASGESRAMLEQAYVARVDTFFDGEASFDEQAGLAGAAEGSSATIDSTDDSTSRLLAVCNLVAGRYEPALAAC